MSLKKIKWKKFKRKFYWKNDTTLFQRWHTWKSCAASGAAPATTTTINNNSTSSSNSTKTMCTTNPWVVPPQRPTWYTHISGPKSSNEAIDFWEHVKEAKRNQKKIYLIPTYLLLFIVCQRYWTQFAILIY